MKKYRLILFFIILLGFLVRLIGSWHGSPFFLGLFDENISVRQVMAFGATRSFKPLTLFYPTLYFYFLFVLCALVYLFGRIIGWFPTLADFAFLYLTHPFCFYFLARLVSVICGTLTILVTYRIAQRVYNKRIGLWAAGLLAMAGTHIIYSHWAKPDIFMVFLSSLSLLFNCFILTDGRFKNYLFAGFFMGLAISAKYNAAFMVVSLLTIHFLTNSKKGLSDLIFDKRLLGYFLMLSTGFLITSPYCIIDSLLCYQEIMHILDYLRFGGPMNINVTSVIWLIIDFLRENYIVGLIFFAGIIYCLLRRRKEHWIFLSFILLYFFFAVKNPKSGLYYFLPAFPAMAIAGALFLEAASVFLYRRKRIPAISIFLLIALAILVEVFNIERSFLSKDSRIAAKEWVEQNIPVHSKIALDGLRYRDYPPLISYGGEFISVDYGPRARAAYQDSRLQELLDRYYAGNKTYRIYKLEKEISDEEVDKALEKIGFPDSVYLRRYYKLGWKGIEELKSQKVEYLILSSFLYGLYEDSPPFYHPLYGFYMRGKEYFTKLMNSRELLLIKEFKPGYSLGPTIRIYKIIY